MARPEVFDKNALEYDAWFERHKIEYALELDVIRELLPQDGTGVEIGAGTGRFTRPLNISLGIEPSRAMGRIAVSRGVNIVAGAAESLPVDAGSHDFALLVTTVCFLDTPGLAFREVGRILKAGGYIIIGLIDSNSILGRKYAEKKNASTFYRDATFHSVDEVRRELEKSGFTGFEYMQALLPADTDEYRKPAIKPGHGEGSFVVIRAQKRALA